MKTRTSFLIVGFLTLAASASRGAAPNAPTRAFLQAHPGTHAMAEGDRLVAIHGATFATDSDPNTTTDQFVAAFLTQNGAALGVQPLDLVLKDKTSIKFGQTMVYTYEQRIELLPVWGSVVKISVLLGPTEKIGYVGIRLVPPPAQPLLADSVSDEQAIASITNGVAYAHLTTYTAAEKTIYEADDATLHRAWRFTGYDDDEAYLFLVDTNSGAILTTVNRVYDADVSGRVTGHSTPCCSADNLNNPESCPDDALGMPGIQVDIDIPGVDPVFADVDGYYLFPPPSNRRQCNGQHAFGGSVGHCGKLGIRGSTGAATGACIAVHKHSGYGCRFRFQSHAPDVSRLAGRPRHGAGECV